MKWIKKFFKNKKEGMDYYIEFEYQMYCLFRKRKWWFDELIESSADLNYIESIYQNLINEDTKTSSD